MPSSPPPPEGRSTLRRGSHRPPGEEAPALLDVVARAVTEVPHDVHVGDPPSASGDDELIVIPALLRAARASYAQAITASLAAAGFDDLPRNGAYVLGGMANRGISLADLIRDLEVTKQAASQLIDTLVLRGYLTRDVNPDDRRRLLIDLTDRGHHAALAIRSGVEVVDAELEGLVSEEQMAGLRAGLLALAGIKQRQRGVSGAPGS